MQERIDVFDSIHKDEMFNNEGWRKSFAGPRHRWAETGAPPNFYRDGDYGTLYHDYGDGTGHFMAFEVNGHVTLFDSAGTTGQYAPSSEELESYLEQFPGREVRFVYGASGPQKVDADTLCQTWSLAWLMRHEYPQIVELLSSAANPRTRRPYLEMTEILDIFRMKLLRHPDPKAAEWIEAYRDVRFHIEEYFWFRVPTSVTQPRKEVMRQLRGG